MFNEILTGKPKGIRLLGLLCLIFAGCHPLYADDAQLQLQRVSLPGSRLTVKITEFQRCIMSDLDAMVLDYRHAPSQAKFLLSLESTNPASTFRGQSAALDLKQIFRQGVSHTFTVPAQSDSDVLGLFICLDSTGAGKCNKKPAVSYEAVFSPYVVEIDTAMRPRLAGSVPDAVPGSDKVYYFQPLLIESGGSRNHLSGAMALDFSKTLFSAPRFSELDALLQQRRSTGTPDLSLTEVKKLTSVLGSLPLRSGAPGELEIQLPRLSTERCGLGS